LITQFKESKLMGTAQVQGELWGNAPQGWAEIQEPLHRPLWEAMMDATGVERGTWLVDLGCGGGGASVVAAERGAQVSGLDAAEGLLAFARQRVPSGDFRQGDIEELPFANDAFDVVFAANSVQYAADRVAALRELGRVCAPNGRIVAGLFSTPEKVAYSAVMKALGAAMPEPPKGGGPFELSMPDKLESLFAEAGLNIIQSSEVDCPFIYPDFETFWHGIMASGPTQGMMRVVTEERLKTAVYPVVEQFMGEDGRIAIQPNFFKYVVATV
jgi:SAM-dependent methyltransferase